MNSFSNSANCLCFFLTFNSKTSPLLLYLLHYLIPPPHTTLCGFSGLPDPFAKVVVDGSGQCHSTDTVRNTLDPKWNQHYDL